MRPELLVVGLIAASMLRVCGGKAEGGDPTAKAEATAAPSAAVSGNTSAIAAGEAHFGGQVVPVGENFVELKLYKRGLVEAWVFDPKGELVTDEKAKLSARAAAGGSARTKVALELDPPSAHFIGHAEAGAKLEPGPVDVELALAGGKSAEGKLDAAVLLVGPEIGGTLVVAGKYGVELVAGADGNVEALVHTAAGAAVDGKAKADLEVKLTGVDGKLHAVALAWSDARARFVGKVEGDAKLAAGPVEVAFDGKVSAKLPKLALRAEAKHEGRIIVAGDYSVELVAKAGVVSAFVFDANGAAHVAGDLDLSLKLGSGAYVKLAWDAPSLSYQAKIDGDIDLDAELSLVVKAQGKVYIGAFAPSAKLSAKADAKLDADAKLAAKAGAGAKAKASITAPKVSVSAPKVSVEKKASASAGTGTGGSAKAKAGFSIGTK